MKRLSALAVILSCFFSAEAALTITEIRTASNKVLVVVLRSTTSNVNEVSTTLSSWKINESSPATLNRYAMAADSCDHHVYLTMATALVEGTQYALQTPYGDTTVTFGERTIFCESIKTNQAAYSALSKNNFANFAIWLGDGGGKKIDGTLPAYEVFEQFTGTVVAHGTLTEKGENPSSGETVYRIDLSDVPEGGPYKISLKGYGCSYPFGVGGNFSRRLAYIIFRGQYYQRCGCPIKAPYGLDIREKACHSTVYKVNGPIGEANITVGSEPSFKCYGGYHDAGDADRRAYHMANPIINLMVYEAFPERFTDGQYNIPDRFDSDYNILGKGNGIPDIVDEAVWGTKIWEYLQNEDGSIQFGTETKGYPDPFDAPLDKDTKKYGTVVTDDRAAATGAGLFMHLARIIRPYDTVYSDQLATRAEKSFSYIGSSIAQPEKLYYYIQKYLFDGDAAAHEQIKSLKTVVDSYKDNLFICHGYSLNNNDFDNPGYVVSYIVEKNRPTDPAVVDYFKAAIKDAADVNMAELANYAYPVGNNPDGTSWGHNVMQPFYACAPLLHWRFSNEQDYLDGACALMNYQLGLNPPGISYVTGLGFHRVHNPHDRESAYTSSMGWGPKPGITIFGPGVIQLFGGATAPKTFPLIDDLPVERKFGDDMNCISTAEFTIFETMCHYALYTVLSDGGTWDETDDPFASQQVGTKKRLNPSHSADNSMPAITVLFSGKSLQLNMVIHAPTRLAGTIFLLNGQKLFSFCREIGTPGKICCTVPIDRTTLDLAANGVVLCRLNAGQTSAIVRVCLQR